MSHTDAVNLHNELNHLSSATDRRDELHRFLEEAPAPRQVPGGVDVVGGAIHAKVLGHDAVAASRPVKIGDDYAIEYDFKVPFEGEHVSLWRFYLWDDGRLTAEPSMESSSVCDFNNQYIKQFIVVAVTNALLQSPVFSPTVTAQAS